MLSCKFFYIQWATLQSLGSLNVLEIITKHYKSHTILNKKLLSHTSKKQLFKHDIKPTEAKNNKIFAGACHTCQNCFHKSVLINSG